LNFVSLVNELSSRFNGFEQVHYLDDEGDQVLMSSDEELALAKVISKGTALKLVLTNGTSVSNAQEVGRGWGRGKRAGGGRNVEDCIRKWVLRKETANHDEVVKQLVMLHSLGFIRFRYNLKILHQHEGDIAKTQQYLQSAEETRRQKEQNKVARGQKRKDGHKHERHCKRAKKVQDPTALAQAQNYRDISQNAFLDFAKVYPWPQHLTRVFVDGNNMFYITGKLRELTLHHKTYLSEKVLSSVAEAFARMVKIRMEVVFDHATSTSAIQLDNGSDFSVSTAHPAFPTSDAKFIDWATKNPNLAPQAVVITSDRALTGELSSLGVSVIKPGVWLHCVAATLTGETSVHYQQWLDAWTEKIVNAQ